VHFGIVLGDFPSLQATPNLDLGIAMKRLGNYFDIFLAFLIENFLENVLVFQEFFLFCNKKREFKKSHQ
jgi:hypothetical protein